MNSGLSSAPMKRDTFELMMLMLELADDSAVSLIQSSCLSRPFEALEIPPSTWYDLTSCDESDTAAVAKSVRYLELRNLLTRHPIHNDLVHLA